MGLLISGCVRPALPKEPVEVDVVEDDSARVVSRSDGKARNVPRTALPADAHEGDVVVDGRVDPVLTAALRTDVERAREKLHRVPVSGHVELEDLPEAPELSSTR